MGDAMTAKQDARIAEAVIRERGRLRNFIRRRIADEAEAEDVLQDVFAELVEAYRATKPIEQVGAWLYRVARNRIIDRFRKRRPHPFPAPGADDDGARASFEDLLPSPDGGPDALYARGILLDTLEDALEELPEDQRAAFVGHEIEGRSFKELADETGVNVNTLVSRKHYAVVALRRRLAAIHDELAEMWRER